jgi:hypothetical protein
MPSAVIGRCRLCLFDGKELQDSHILSKWTYKRIRGSGANPNPVLVTDGRASQTSRQVKEYLLCTPCEQRLGVNENYSSTVANQQDGSAPIFDHVLRMGEPEPGGAALGVPTTLDCEKVLRFGSSVLWRSHLSSRVPKCSLRADHAEAFRRYLLGEVGFPNDAACVLLFIEDAAGKGSPVNLLCTVPLTVHGDDFDSTRMLICGLHFEFAVGPAIPDVYREFCFARGDPRYVLLSSSYIAIDWIGPMFTSAKRTGSFAKAARTK